MLFLRILLKMAPLLFFFIFGRLLKEMIGGAQNASSSNDRAKYTPPPGGVRRDPYSVLGCSSSSSNDEIKKSYREMLSRYHPDKFIGQNLDEDFVALASRKFQEIQEAYSRIRSARGF